MDGTMKLETTMEARPEAKAAAVPLLHIHAGLHAGARTPLGLSDMLVIGTSDDCDVILSDAGIARHHCILMRQGRRLSLRAVDAALTVAGRAYQPGQTVRLPFGATVGLGAAEFRVEHADAGAAAPADAAAATPALGAAGLLRRYRWGLAASTVTLAALGLGIAAVELQAQPVAAVPSADEVASRTVSRLGLDEVTTSRNESGEVEVRGVVPDAHSEAQLRQDLAQRHVAAAVAVRSGADVAGDVVEVLRLSGIAAQAQYGGDGAVTVRGHLGPQPELAAVIQSRAMHEIQGLKRVVAYNEDHPGQTVASSAPESKRIVSVIATGEDPYVVTADGSHYYVGAELPQGGRLSGVEPDALLIERGGKIDRLSLPGVRFGS